MPASKAACVGEPIEKEFTGLARSICTLLLWTDWTLPTLSYAAHLTVLELESETSATAAETVVAVPLEVGSESSVVYSIFWMSAPASLAVISKVTGTALNQPAQLPLLHVVLVVGAVESALTVKLELAVRPALFVAVTVCEAGSAAPAENV